MRIKSLVLVGVELLICMAGLRGTALSQSTGAGCPRVPGAAGTTIGPRPVGDIAGSVLVRGKRTTAWVTDVLSIDSRSDSRQIGWLYIDQFGLKWVQLRTIPSGSKKSDFGGVPLIVGSSVSAMSGMINPEIAVLRRCLTIE
jgi:hypothetical protein